MLFVWDFELALFTSSSQTNITLLLASEDNIVEMASGLFNDASLALFARVVAPRPSANQTNRSTPISGSKRRRSDEDEEADAANNNESNPSMSNEGQRSHQDAENTVFVGNLPISMDEKAVSRFFRECGDIASVRLRSIPVEGTKIDDPGNQNLVKKVCKEQGKIGKQKGSLNAYVVFKEPSSIATALAMNNNVIAGRHIRVDLATPTLFDPSRTLFIGNLPFLADEEELRSFIADRLPGGDEEVEGVRIVRDQETLIGKGIAYVLLRSRDAVISGLAINKVSQMCITILCFPYIYSAVAAFS